MALREYEWRGSTYQFEQGKEPEGARLVAVRPAPARAAKGSEPRDKARTARNK